MTPDPRHLLRVHPGLGVLPSRDAVRAVAWVARSEGREVAGLLRLARGHVERAARRGEPEELRRRAAELLDRVERVFAEEPPEQGELY